MSEICKICNRLIWTLNVSETDRANFNSLHFIHRIKHHLPDSLIIPLIHGRNLYKV